MAAGLAASGLFWSGCAGLPRDDRKRCFAAWPILILGLPVSSSLQFVFGYPLRTLAAHSAAWMLPGKVTANGCGLSNGRVEVFVDAPCAGASMLTASLLLAAGAALLFGLSFWRTALLLIGGLFCSLAANALRAAFLYAGTAGLVAIPLQNHETLTGLFCFAAGGGILTMLAHGLSKTAIRTDPPVGDNRAIHVPARRGGQKALIAVHLLVCLFVAIWPAGERGRAREEKESKEPIRWPAAWEGKRLLSVRASPDMEAFRKDFPGECREFLILPADEDAGSFLTEAERVVFRHVQRATRQLHPAEDCFRGAGHRVTPRPLHVDAHGRRWSVFAAEKEGIRRMVRQCVISVAGGDLRDVADSPGAAPSWPDVSSWYWEAAGVGGKTEASALAVTIISGEG
jgi:exosortase/archaeosortase family protein